MDADMLIANHPTAAVNPNPVELGAVGARRVRRTRRPGRCSCRKDREPTTVQVDSVGLVVSRDGVDRDAGRLTWDNWQRVGYTERLKTGAGAVRGAMVRTPARGERSP
jgi:hypothetical protein